ncbi:50S ribosomal protein L9 [Oscillochloris sp. ZM17-4]|nr:50S ribosomal protein L9 [Oscillochloris sp. ZM17-4]MBX0327146.1 50S ribosomal protein L9 [Oscillochloris sp. ZM17-4]
MKVLLTNDVEHLGKAGELKDVSGGFGRNYLIPKGFAVLATRGQIRQAEERMSAQRRRAEVGRKDAQALAARINGVSLHFSVKVGEQDRLYGSVTNVDIAEKLKAQIGIEIDRRKIDLEDPIKRTGIYAVKVQLLSDLAPVLNVIVEPEGGAPEAEAPATEDGPSDSDIPEL